MNRRLTLMLMAVAALVLLAFSRSRWALQHSRLFSLVVILLSTIGSYHMDLRLGSDVNQAERFVLADVTGALLVAVVVVPALPWQMFTGLREQISPTILAVATILVALSIMLLATVEILRRRSERLRGMSPG